MLKITFQRYRQVPQFACDTIRRFSSNCSGLKRLAARDFEDLLQVGIFAGHLLIERADAPASSVRYSCIRRSLSSTPQQGSSEAFVSVGVLAWISKAPYAH